ncbi:T9SS type B sorting domain-containing protein [Winogradskyella psychrotolerans]|uniref:T9SS type B sorting domain-containing protein n=1 Tax=Winogradskyella psychrotolerans TaxID=1344585 RepID=UPI001C06F7B3|nr:T9SS type B sorting domain-containing protein [Winogradskyella psychrotolerans]MBU2928849.1 T9SS type B sorting domain-containing protein [Winogradskyella psychrotolerans]
MKKNLKFEILIILTLIGMFNSNAQVLVGNGSCSEIDEASIYGCSWGGINWAKTYDLTNFGIDNNEELLLTSGEIGLDWVGTWDVNIRFNIYEIDADFPNSFSEADLIGSSQVVPVQYFGQNNPQIIAVDFDTPILIPSDISLILVEVEQLSSLSSGAVAFAGNIPSDGSLSWFRSGNAGCPPMNYTSTVDLGYSDANFHITVSGGINNINNPFTLNFSDDCTTTFREFNLTSINDINSVAWDFGDPTSGTNNTSTLNSPTHHFTAPGQYLITVTITPTVGATYIISETISVAEPPMASPINNLHSCEDAFGSGISSNFDTSNVESQVLNGQSGVIVTYYDQNSNELPSPLPNPYTNTITNSQEITVRVSNSNNLCCFTETSFNLITDPLPILPQIDTIFSCDNDEDGFTVFDLANVPNELINGQSGLLVELFDSNNNLILVPNYNNFNNLTANQDFIKAIATDTTTTCSSEININLIVNDNPEANQLPTIYGCDDNNDGISEYFDTSNIESQVLNGQTGMSVSYFDQSDNELPNPLPNPYTNSNTFNESITVRVTDNNSTCYSETTLQLQTVTQPNINQPNNLYACDQGNGYAEFDTSSIEQQLIGNQTSLTIQYFDSENTPLTSPLPTLFQNTEPFSQTISIRVEDASNPICYSETSFDLIVNELPVINLEDNYYICNLEPSISLDINSGYNSYGWFYQDGTLMSTTNTAVIADEGTYVLTVTEIENGVTCENSFEFSLIRSVLPEIQQVNFKELGNNHIEIIASGDGDFEYSIDGINYQDSNYFSNIEGGMYTVFVRDKDGCGQDSEEVTIIDYPKFFTPNNDGYNDFWQIKGIVNFPNSKTLIFDRYGKLLAKISSNDLGWNGLYNGKQMMSNDYWFRTDLSNGRTFSGHFSLKR